MRKEEVRPNEVRFGKKVRPITYAENDGGDFPAISSDI